MYDPSKKNFRRRKKGLSTVTHAEMVDITAHKAGLKRSTIEKVILTYLSTVVDAVKSKEIVPVPIIGSFGLSPGKKIAAPSGKAQSHTDFYFWVDRELRAQCYYLQPNESTIREQDRHKVPVFSE